MLVITAEIWPGGHEGYKHKIGEITIANVSGLADVSSYSVAITQTGDPISGAPALQAELIVEGHRRADGAWALVRTILDQAIPSARGERSSTEDQRRA
jgi:hypothetical protein